jgi:hypothetical protein
LLHDIELFFFPPIVLSALQRRFKRLGACIRFTASTIATMASL